LRGPRVKVGADHSSQCAQECNDDSTDQPDLGDANLRVGRGFLWILSGWHTGALSLAFYHPVRIKGIMGINSLKYTGVLANVKGVLPEDILADTLYMIESSPASKLIL
jgi:hypothetical protein